MLKMVTSELGDYKRLVIFSLYISKGSHCPSKMIYVHKKKTKEIKVYNFIVWAFIYKKEGPAVRNVMCHMLGNI